MMIGIIRVNPDTINFSVLTATYSYWQNTVASSDQFLQNLQLVSLAPQAEIVVLS